MPEKWGAVILNAMLGLAKEKPFRACELICRLPKLIRGSVQRHIKVVTVERKHSSLAGEKDLDVSVLPGKSAFLYPARKLLRVRAVAPPVACGIV